MQILKHIARIASAMILVLTYSCEDIGRIESQIEDLENRVANLETAIADINNNTISVRALLKESIAILGVTQKTDGYTIELSDGNTLEIVDGLSAAGQMPIIGVNEKLEWIISTDNGETFDKIENTIVNPGEAMTPQVRVNADGNWEISTDGGNSWSLVLDKHKRPVSATDGKVVAGVKTFFTEINFNEVSGYLDLVLADGRSVRLETEKSFLFEVLDHKENETILPGETKTFKVNAKDIEEVAIKVPEGWRASYTDNELTITSPEIGENGVYEITLIAVSSKGYMKYNKVVLTLEPIKHVEGQVQEWIDYIYGRATNVLLDFSYAGYKRGEEAPADVTKLGYRIYNVALPKYGAVPNDGKSDREAFLKVLEDIFGTPSIDANNCISFPHKPEANAVIYFPEGEYILHTDEDDNDKGSQSILIRGGHFTIKGDGRGKTKLIMNAPMLPTDPKILYSSPDMIQLKHNSGFRSFAIPAIVTEDSPKGSFKVTVSSTASLSRGDWVCLHVKSNSSKFIAKEMEPYTAPIHWEIAKSGVEVIDYHQIKEIRGNEVIFHEPLHHAVEAQMEWEIKEYPHYENVGVEDLTFVGNAKDNFIHHGSWEDDGAYKPISLNRVTDSWIRRVGFESVSEACSIINSANVSAYDIEMTGRRGHAAVRSQASSRVLIAATIDKTSDGTGNWHGVGVSRQSIGTVLWRNTWGDDSCFESHSTQPRATLIDCCIGGWHRRHQGGDSHLAPNHLADLTIWNFNATKVSESNFVWWGSESEPWWKFLPPIIVGFQSSESVTFNPDQTKVISSHNMKPDPESLYETQLKHRLGYIPGWLNELK